MESFTKAVDMEVLKSNLDSSGVLTDAWGGTIYYRSPGEFKRCKNISHFHLTKNSSRSYVKS